MRQKSNSTPASSETLVRTIRRATRKHHAAEEKIGIVLDGLRGDEHRRFTSLRTGMSFLNLAAQPAERRWSWWGRVIFYVVDVDALYERALAAGYQPTY